MTSPAVQRLHANIASHLERMREAGEVEHWSVGSNGKRSVWEIHFTDSYCGQHAHLFTPEVDRLVQARARKLAR